MPHPEAPWKICNRGHKYRDSDPCPVCWPGFRTYDFQAKVWLYDGQAAWHFVTVPPNVSATIKERFGQFGRGFGSLPVVVTIGETSWKTSIFPDKKRGGYLLPLKAAVRKKENINIGDSLKLTLEIQE